MRVPLAIVLGAVVAIATCPPTSAQEQDVTMQLQAQIPWTTLQHPVLRLAVRVSNQGAEAIDELSLGVALGAAVRARNEFDGMMVEGPPFIVFAPAPTPVKGSLEPGSSRILRLEADLTGAVSAADSLVYPARISLFAAGRPVATLPIPIVHVVREPEVPVSFTWWTTFAAGPVLDPEERLIDTGFEAAIAPGGSLMEQTRAVARIAERDRPTSLQVVVEPLLLEQLAILADGYVRADGSTVAAGIGAAAHAEELLGHLRMVAADPSIGLVQLPYAAPELPAMLRSGLGEQLELQYRLSDELTGRILGRTGEDDVGAVPDDALDEPALGFLAGRGVTAVLTEADTVARPAQEQFFAPPPTATIPLTGDAEMALVLPDPGTQALFERADLLADPVRLAQTVLAELAVIWREQPVPAPPTVRGIAVSVPPDLPPAAWGPLMMRLAAAPFLSGTTASGLVDVVNPKIDGADLATPSIASFTDPYVRNLRAAEREIDALSWTLLEDTDLPLELRKDLAVAQSGTFVGLEAQGRAWVAAVTAHTRSSFRRLAPLPEQVFTLTSATGTIPIRFGDPAAPRRVVVELQSSWFSFPNGAAREVTLREADRAVPFIVEARAPGRRSIRVLVRAGPAGSVIAARDIVVGSTVADRVALFITGAAALVLLALWARRLFPRTRT